MTYIIDNIFKFFSSIKKISELHRICYLTKIFFKSTLAIYKREVTNIIAFKSLNINYFHNIFYTNLYSFNNMVVK